DRPQPGHRRAARRAPARRGGGPRPPHRRVPRGERRVPQRRTAPRRHRHRRAAVRRAEGQGAGVMATADAAPARRGYAYPLLAPALAAWATAFVLVGLPAPVAWSVATAAAAAVAALALVPRLRRRAAPSSVANGAARWPAGRASAAERRGRWDARTLRRVSIGVLRSVAAVATGLGCWAHVAGTGPVAELARARAAVTAEVVLTGDPRAVTGRGGAVPRDRVVADGRVELVEVRGRRIRLRAPVLLFGNGPQWHGLLP